MMIYCCVFFFIFFFFCKQKTAYDIRISDLSSDVCSSDLAGFAVARDRVADPFALCDVRARLEIEAGAREPDAVFASKGLFGIEECLQRSEIERRERTVTGQIGRASCRERVLQYV